MADLAGEHLREVLPEGIRLLKISSDRLVEDGYAEGHSDADLIAGLERLRDLGAHDVVVSREREPALALIEGQAVEVRGPRFKALDPHGRGTHRPLRWRMPWPVGRPPRTPSSSASRPGLST